MWVQARQHFPDLGLLGFILDRIDHAHGDAAFREPVLPGDTIAGNVDKPAPQCAAAGAPDVGDSDDINQLPAAVGDPPLFNDRVMPGDEPDLGSRLLVQVFRHSPLPCYLFADAEIGEDPVKDLFRRRAAGDLSK
jgi:hypothetical protein